MDELTQRVRALNAERARREPPPTDRRATDVDQLMQRLIAALHDLYRTDPDSTRKENA